MSVGCVQLSLKEILVFGGFTDIGDMQDSGRILMLENEDKGNFMFLQAPVNLQAGDGFAN